MEVLTQPEGCGPEVPVVDNHFLQISCNWKITNNKEFREVFTTAVPPQTFEKTNFDDVVSLETCISLQPIQNDNEPCVLDVRVTNGQRISRIAVVSEAYVLEFFKQFGEYEGTVFAEFIDEFEDNTVYFAETNIVPSASEASIKFTKTKKKVPLMWIYGIRVYLTEPVKQRKEIETDIFSPEQIQSFLTKLNFNDENSLIQSNNRTERHESDVEGNQTARCKNDDINEITISIDKKFRDMETRLMKKIDDMEERLNKKLDMALKLLEMNLIRKD